MSTLILDTPDYQLSLQQELLHIAHPEYHTRVYPLAAFERLVLGKGISVTTDLQLKLSELGKELVLLGHKSSAALFNPYHAPNGLRLVQYQAVIQPTWRTILIRLLLLARWRGQNRILRRLQQPILPAFPLNQENLMAAEAQMSHHYWQAWSRCFSQDGFNGRVRQPPTDPLNALLSLSATLDDQALIAPLLAEGFDVALGLHHATGYRRPSLVLDIKELTRADVEGWVLSLWQSGLLQPAHFSYSEQGCRLTREGQQRFYPAWYRWQKRRKTSVRRLVRLCRRILLQVVSKEA